jgi:hypothetical protein
VSGNTTATERLLEVSNKLWDAMYESGEVPTYSERYHYYRALKDAMDEDVKLRELVRDIDEVADTPLYDFIGRRMRALGIEVGR